MNRKTEIEKMLEPLPVYFESVEKIYKYFGEASNRIIDSEKQLLIEFDKLMNKVNPKTGFYYFRDEAINEVLGEK